MRSRASLSAIAILLAVVMVLSPVVGASSRPFPQDEGPDSVPARGPTPVPSPAPRSLLPVPSGYVHRPSIEFFTGLSCPSCMDGPHPDMEKLWEENGYDPKQDFSYVVFHELNGGGVDDLNDQDATDRMRFYQPGISGTPDSEFDGGYIELGGMTGGTLNYNTAKQAVSDSQSRYETKLNPLHPIQSLRNGFKFVKLEVRQIFDGSSGFTVMAKATYLGTSALVETKSLNGELYVFMVEDNVTAYSKVEKADVLNHNVFRGYALKGEAFSLKSGASKEFTAQWSLPRDAKVPVKPGDVSAVAVVYDADDTTSQPGTQGNPNRVPRAVQSATPLSTAYDSQNDIPRASDVKLAEFGDGVKLVATLDDANGIAMAYALYNTVAANATNWSVAQFNLTGTECEGETCSVYNNATGSAVLKARMDQKLFVTLLLYDGNMTQGKLGLTNLTAQGAGAGGGGPGLPAWAAGAFVAAAAVIGVFYLWKKKLIPIPSLRKQ